MTEQTGKPHIAKLSLEAKELRRQWHNAVEGEMADGHELESCRDIAAKMVTQCAKIALVFHLLEHPEYLQTAESEISGQTWDNAQRLAEYFLSTAIRFRDATQANQSDAHRLTEWLRKTKRQMITVRDVMRDGPSPRMRYAGDVSLALDQMREQGVVRQNPSREGEWQVNPKLFVAVSHVAGKSPLK